MTLFKPERASSLLCLQKVSKPLFACSSSRSNFGVVQGSPTCPETGVSTSGFAQGTKGHTWGSDSHSPKSGSAAHAREASIFETFLHPEIYPGAHSPPRLVKGDTPLALRTRIAYLTNIFGRSKNDVHPKGAEKRSAAKVIIHGARNCHGFVSPG